MIFFLLYDWIIFQYVFIHALTYIYFSLFFIQPAAKWVWWQSHPAALQCLLDRPVSICQLRNHSDSLLIPNVHRSSWDWGMLQGSVPVEIKHKTQAKRILRRHSVPGDSDLQGPEQKTWSILLFGILFVSQILFYLFGVCSISLSILTSSIYN